jgi:hypothetical protein
MQKGFSALALFCLSAAGLMAQVTATATLQGTVTDKTGASVPGAEVRALNRQTGETRVETSNNAGLYVFNLLPAGTYQVRVAMKGFATAAFENVELAVSRTTTIDAQLSTSQQSETITVEATGAGLVDMQKTDVSLPITQTEV